MLRACATHGIAYVTAGHDCHPDLRRLEAEGDFAVTVVTGSKRGLNRPLPGDVACIVVDHDPPAVDGLAATNWLRDRYGSIPIVLFPSDPSEKLVAAAVNVGIDAYVRPSAGGTVNVLRSQLRRLTASVRSERVDADDSQAGTSRRSTPSDAMSMLEALTTSLPRWVSIYVKDRLGRHVVVSGSATAFDGDAVITTPDDVYLHSREDILGQTDFDLYPLEHARATRAKERRIMRTEEPIVNVTETVDDPPDGVNHYSTTKAPWYDRNGAVSGIVGITVDITARIERERDLERQNERLDQFAGVLSHDIRNPLAVASGQVELLAECDLPGAPADSLDDLEWSLDRIESLIDDTLTLAREGTAVTDPARVDLRDVADSAWRTANDDRGTLTLDDGLPAVSGDPDRIQRLFANALNHGRTDEPSGPLSIAVGSLDDGFFVGDDGVGVPEEHRERIFDHGFTTRTEGTGFGLAIVEEIATAHDWQASVTDSDRDGARFEFRDVKPRNGEGS